ncbi:SIP domain-containing protein [Seohaeicola nanhaiensis]|uniref:SIP domain-containing protein n=1 Tax=Seohaeicola nanhaiensis TaxID=1387282 RepID=A0ABV9KAW7_9RHOB
MQMIHAQIHDVTPAEVLPTFTEFAEILEIDLERDDDGLALSVSGGRIGMRAAPGGLALRLEADTDRRLYLLQQMVMNRLDRLTPVPRLDWERVDAGALPPNLSIATVEDMRRISPNFTRVRVSFEDVARYAEDGLHFRLLISALPPDRARGGSVVQWPHIDARGRTRWPEGDAALHRPVYTVRDVDPAAGWMDFDVFLHDGGRVSAWTERARPGDRIGLMGPTTLKRDMPGWVALCGDETALPAIALYLRSLPEGTHGHALISCADPADRQALIVPPGVTLDWIDGTPGALVAALKALPLPPDNRFVYFGAERSDADEARKWLREVNGLSRAEANVTAFWSHGDEETIS